MNVIKEECKSDTSDASDCEDTPTMYLQDIEIKEEVDGVMIKSEYCNDSENEETAVPLDEQPMNFIFCEVKEEPELILGADVTTEYEDNNVPVANDGEESDEECENSKLTSRGSPCSTLSSHFLCSESTTSEDIRIGEGDSLCEFSSESSSVQIVEYYKTSKNIKLKERKSSHTKLISCNICNKVFTKSYHLTRHLRTHTGERPYSCGICNKTFCDGSTLKKHKYIHNEEQSNPYIPMVSCDVCNKKFSRAYDLKRHVLIHTGEQPFYCHICRKKFRDKISLDKHKQSHAILQPFSCDVCIKSFRTKYDLNRHARIHTGERPYSCDICCKTFADRGNLRKHERIHVAKQPLSSDR